MGMRLMYTGSDDNSYGWRQGEVYEIDFEPSASPKDGIFLDWYWQGHHYYKDYSSLKAFTQEWADAIPTKRHGRKR